jgi:hypothetical protein
MGRACRAHRPMSGEGRPPNQERRASARRGTVNRTPVPQESRTVQRPCDTESRAAGVSPPWYGEPNAVPQKSRTVQRPRDAGTRAAGVSPPWVLGKRTCRNTFAKSRGTAGGVLTNAGGVAVANHGGLTPPALGAERTSAGEKTIFAMQERTFTRAAGVSPPWYGEPNAVPRKPRTAQRLCDTESRAPGVSPPWV